MVTSEMMTEMVTGKRPSFAFTCEGIVQHVQNENGTGMVIATTREAAKVMADAMTKAKGKRVSVFDVGSAQGEALSVQIARSVLQKNATGVHVTEDGDTLYYFKAPPAHDYEETV